MKVDIEKLRKLIDSDMDKKSKKADAIKNDSEAIRMFNLLEALEIRRNEIIDDFLGLVSSFPDCEVK